MKIAILGAGAWGTALGVTLSGRHDVVLWARDAALVDSLAADRVNRRYLPEAVLPASLQVTAEFDRATAGGELAIVATPVAGLRETLARLVPPGLPVVWVCKGFEAGGARLPHAIASDVLPVGTPCGVLSGPSFAQEVAAGLPAALTLASADGGFAARIARELHGARLRVYSSEDIVGVEIAGAVKNVMAIAAGISDGLGLGLNARAALVTRGLAEITRLGRRLGGRAETFMGLAGMGDLILTCTGDLSRNRKVGLAIGRGGALADALGGLGHVAEGVRSAPELRRLARELGVDMPIAEAVCRVLFDGVAPGRAVEDLLAREPRPE